MAEKTVIIQSDENADWIKTGKGHKLEAKIHDELARRYKAQGQAKGQKRQDTQADEGKER